MTSLSLKPINLFLFITSTFTAYTILSPHTNTTRLYLQIINLIYQMDQQTMPQLNTISSTDFQKHSQTDTPEWGLPLVNGKYSLELYPFQYTQNEFIENTFLPSVQLQQTLTRYFRHFSQLPVLGALDDIHSIVMDLTKERFPEDFCLSTCFNPLYICNLMFNGFLPIGDAYPHLSPTHEYRFQYLLPKLHVRRCVMDWRKFLIPHGIIQKSKSYTFTINKDIEAVIAGCVNQHSDAWLYPTYRKVLAQLNKDDNVNNVHLLSVEVWMSYNELYEYLYRQYEALVQAHSDPKGEKADKMGHQAEKEKKYTNDHAKQFLNLLHQFTPHPNSPTMFPEDSTTEKDDKNDHKNKLKTKTRQEIEQLWSIKKSNITLFLAQYPSLSSLHTTTQSRDTEAYFSDNHYLVSGELGYTINDKYYCSMTGFKHPVVNGSGSVQLYALATLLQHSGVECWDLGMIMDYKKNLGAIDIPRAKFVQYLYENVHRNVTIKERLANKDTNPDKLVNDNEKISPENTPKVTPTRPLPVTVPLCVENYNFLCQKNAQTIVKQKLEINSENHRKALTSFEKKERWINRKYGDDESTRVDYLNRFCHPTILEKIHQDNVAETEKLHCWAKNPSTAEAIELKHACLVSCHTMLKLRPNIQDLGWSDPPSTLFPPLKKKSTSTGSNREL